MLDQRIKTVRTAKGMTQVQLAKILGVTKQSVSNWENDNILPSIEMLKKLSLALSVSADYLLGLDDRLLLDVSDLSETELEHVKQIVSDITRKK